MNSREQNPKVAGDADDGPVLNFQEINIKS